jgi:hypothetical protein
MYYRIEPTAVVALRSRNRSLLGPTQARRIQPNQHLIEERNGHDTRPNINDK